MKIAGLLLLCCIAFADEPADDLRAPITAPHLARVMPPAGQVSVTTARRGAAAYLVKSQNADGSFGRSTIGRHYELWCHVPGGHQAFQAASTALCWLGLHGVPQAEQTPASQRAAAKALAWLVGHARVKRPFPAQFYNVWSFGYGLRALAVALRTKAGGAKPAAIRKTIDEILKAIAVYQTPDGGWGYLDFKMAGYKPSWSTSFTTATVLVGLHEAERAGIEVSAYVKERALRLMRRYRTPDGNYLYSIDWKWRPTGRINRPQGSSLRNQACNLAIHLFAPQDMGKKKLRIGLDQLVKYHRFAIAGLRRPIPHESWYAVSGYFYLYGQQYAACVLEHLDAADHARYWPDLVKFTMKTRQHDGSFWDYPTYGYHKAYGTGYALMTLNRCPPQIAAGLKPKG